MQLCCAGISEPGAEEALNVQWEGKVGFARGPESIATMIGYYTDGEEARLACQRLLWEFAHNLCNYTFVTSCSVFNLPVGTIWV